MRNGDVALLSALVLAFAILVTVHLGIALGVARRAGLWRASAALVLFPLAPYWAFRTRMYVRGATWILAAVTYAIARGQAV